MKGKLEKKLLKNVLVKMMHQSGVRVLWGLLLLSTAGAYAWSCSAEQVNINSPAEELSLGQVEGSRLRRLCPYIMTTVYWSNSADATKQRMLNEGSIFEILGSSKSDPEWYRIRDAEGVGWIWAKPIDGKAIVCDLPQQYYVCSDGASFRFSNDISSDQNIARIFEPGEAVRVTGADASVRFLTVVDGDGKEGFLMPQHLCAADSSAYKELFSGWMHPVTDTDERRCSSAYGWRVDPVTGFAGAFHGGVDFASAHGTPLTPVDDGVVEYAGPYGGYGNAVIIRHTHEGKTLKSLYGHLSSIAVAPGNSVSAPGTRGGGTIIGRVGSTGKSTGPHLHLEARTAGDEQLNPEQFFKQNLGCR